MSAIKRAVAQKAAAQQAEVIAVAPIAVEAMPVVENALAAAAVAEDKVEQAQDIVALAQEELPVELAQMAEEFHAESVAFANENANGEILLAQAGQDKKDDGGAALTDDDGGLGAGGWAALIGLGVIAAAGGGGGASTPSPFTNDPDNINLLLLNPQPIVNVNSNTVWQNVTTVYSNVLGGAFDASEDHLLLPTYLNVSGGYDTSTFGGNQESLYTVLKGILTGTTFAVDNSGSDYLIVWDKSGIGQEYAVAVTGLLGITDANQQTLNGLIQIA